MLLSRFSIFKSIEHYKYDGIEVFAFTLYETVDFEAFACGRCGEYIVDTGSGP